MKLILLVLCLATAACGSSSVNALDGTDAGGGDASASNSADGSASNTQPVPPDCRGGAPSSISGTWNVISTRGAQTVDTVVTIDQSHFRVAWDDRSLDFTASGSTMSLLWTDRGRSTPITTQHTPTAHDFGLLPIA